MKFKGSKVFPKYLGGDNYSVDLIFDNGATISIDRRDRYSDNVVCERSEMEANALLISKAPEMLEMLKKCKIMCEHLSIAHVSQELEQLIKEATEL